jgi:hypothetical protein
MQPKTNRFEISIPLLLINNIAEEIFDIIENLNYIRFLFSFRMRKNIFYFLCILCGFFWLGTVYFLSVNKSSLPSNESRNETLQNK